MKHKELIDNNQTLSKLTPPQSINAEQDIIGGVLSDNKSWEEIVDIISENDFYRKEHKILFKAIHKLLSEDKPADVLTLIEYLKQNNELENIGGKDYIISLVQNTFSTHNIKRYAELVRDKSILRQLAIVANEIAKKAYDYNGQDTKEILDYAENRIFQIAEQSQKNQEGLQKVDIVLKRVNERITKLYHEDNKSGLTGVSTGFMDLDKMTSGLQTGDLIIVAGRPSMGKTAFAMNIAQHTSINLKLPIAVFSMEMSSDQLLMRILSSIGEINQSSLKTGKLKDTDLDKYGYAIELLSGSPIYIDESPALTPLEIKARSRRLARLHNGQLGLIIIDYIQLMSVANFDTRDNNRANEVAQISRSLKALAKELKVPIIALSQLSRNVENRSDKRPLMSDLRESGAIEQDADIIIFMYRDSYYKKTLENTAEAIISKHRNGPTGTIKLLFLGEYAKFQNYTENYDIN